MKNLFFLSIIFLLLSTNSLIANTIETISAKNKINCQSIGGWEYLKKVSIYWSSGYYVETRKADCYMISYFGNDRSYKIRFYIGKECIEHEANPNYYFKQTNEWYGKYQYVADGYYFNL